MDGTEGQKMREILFRGQTRKRGQKVWMDGSPVDSNWVYGGIFPGTGDYSVIYGATKESITGLNLEKHFVYSDTVGQFTGMTDKNGKKIFEGDIVKEADIVHNGEIQIPGHIFCVVMRHGCWCVIPAKDAEEWDFLNSYIPTIEVIGNIHDSPELLEVSEDG